MKPVQLTVVILTCLAVLTGCGGGDQPAVEVTGTSGPDKPSSNLVGTSINDFPDDGLIDQDSTPVSIGGLPDKPVMMSFIFTRCPVKSMCPRVTDNMATIQDKVNKQGKQPAHFVLVTFDPAYDRPSVLRQYAEQYGINHENFSLWTGNPRTVEKLISRFNIMVKKENGQPQVHNMKTFLIDEKGIIRHQFRGSDWTVREIQAPLMRMIAGG